MKEITFGELKNGDIIYNQGYEFIATDVRRVLLTTGGDAIRYKGVCTDSDRNNSIRDTGYNGGTYGALAQLRTTIK